MAGQVKGTPAYMAPEQARGEPVNARADVFALGGILAVLLTGKPPFRGNTVMDTVLKAAQAELGECFAHLDACGANADLIAVTKRCLVADAVQRFANGAEIAERVATYRARVEKQLNLAERDRAVSEEQLKRRKVQVLLVVIVAAFMIAGGAVAWWQERQATKRKTQTELGDALYREGKLEEALNAYKEGNKPSSMMSSPTPKRSGEARGLTDLGRTYLQMERYQEARDFANNAIHADPSFAPAHQLLDDIRDAQAAFPKVAPREALVPVAPPPREVK